MVIPTLESHDANFEFLLSIYSNKPVELISLNKDSYKVLISEWALSNAAGSHLSQEIFKPKGKLAYGSRTLLWHENPTFRLTFESKERIPELEFEIILARSEKIWSNKVTSGIVNSMIGLYLFQFEKDNKWKTDKKYLLNQGEIEFLPKNEISYFFKFTRADPRGYIIMPSTYGPNVYGPFILYVRCNEKFALRERSSKDTD